MGAGFATGREIAYFFARYGKDGLKGCLLTGAMLALLGAATAIQTEREGHLQSGNGLWGRFIRLSALIAGICVLSGVLAGCDRVCTEQLSLPRNFGMLFMGILSCAVIRGGFRRVGMASSFMAPLLLIWALWLGGSTICRNRESWLSLGSMADSEPSWDWLFSAVVYVSYNFLIAYRSLERAASFVVSAERKGRRGGPGYAWVTAALSGVIIGLMAFAVCVAELLQPDSLLFEVPALRLCAGRGTIAWVAYFVVLTAALASTAVGALYGLAFSLNEGWGRTPEIITAVAAALAQLGLGTIVERIYPILGFAGLILIASELGGVAKLVQNKGK